MGRLHFQISRNLLTWELTTLGEGHAFHPELVGRRAECIPHSKGECLSFEMSSLKGGMCVWTGKKERDRNIF